MDIFEKALRTVVGGRVLDVATQEGRFVQILIDNLQSCTQVIGIDITEPAIKTAHDTIGAAHDAANGAPSVPMRSTWFLPPKVSTRSASPPPFTTSPRSPAC